MAKLAMCSVRVDGTAGACPCADCSTAAFARQSGRVAMNGDGVGLEKGEGGGGTWPDMCGDGFRRTPMKLGLFKSLWVGIRVSGSLMA